ncbi:30S ribosomal protein S6 [Oecophyllibacter saccharovorans]|uniref:Small ribosomal subunit protein bS6 n=1 Tax=Oecophyllibacter saccharovorans TaxID=2558360 RepID=A0A506URB6_9PROT|nr:30S ribosomal protein S6 [Oecophyllibacter saccharovorans]TPW34957.1 30S ribosomal protein S6 [Oecophyllibacter saccharovorans]TPW35896.1 30S ribosomal protein S6 [Oecophyllibacter saccharovorans]
MPLYETVLIARNDVSPAQVEAIVDNITNLLGEYGGKVLKREFWGLRTLAYRIKKNRKGHYVLLGIEAPIAAMREMERQLGLNEDILRVMTLRVEDIDEAPSPMMSRKDERGERNPSRGGGGRSGGRFESGRSGGRRAPESSEARTSEARAEAPAAE